MVEKLKIMHHKNEVSKIIQEGIAGTGIEIDIAKIHQLMDDYAVSIKKPAPFIMVSDCDHGYKAPNKNYKSCKIFCAMKKEDWEK